MLRCQVKGQNIANVDVGDGVVRVIEVSESTFETISRDAAKNDLLPDPNCAAGGSMCGYGEDASLFSSRSKKACTGVVAP
jgi:hypothetical protein